MRGGKRPGAGRPRGAQNRVTTSAKRAFLATFGRLEGDLEAWIRRTAEGVPKPLIVNGEIKLGDDGAPVTVPTGADPGKAAELLIRMAEYHFPKLGRLVDESGGDVTPIVIERIIVDPKKT